MRLRYALSRFLGLFKRGGREIHPSAEEMAKAREIMSKINVNREIDIVKRVAEFKTMIEGQSNGGREE